MVTKVLRPRKTEKHAQAVSERKVHTRPKTVPYFSDAWEFLYVGVFGSPCTLGMPTHRECGGKIRFHSRQFDVFTNGSVQPFYLRLAALYATGRGGKGFRETNGGHSGLATLPRPQESSPSRELSRPRKG